MNYAVLYGKDMNFLRLNGLFPQEQKVDDWKNFILFDQKEIERLVKKGIVPETGRYAVDFNDFMSDIISKPNRGWKTRVY